MKQQLRDHFEKTVPITDEVFEYIFSHFSWRRLKRQQFLVQEGDTVRNNYWVAKGLLKSFYIDENGKEHILQFAMEDWWISDYHALFNKTPATLNIDCIEDSEIFVLSLESSEKLSRELIGFSNFFLQKTSMGYAALQQRILLLLFKNPQERYERLMQLNPALLQRVPKTLLAAYLGVSRESLSRLNRRQV